jgi:HAD superfamily hydrolase (TIGR01549 family)
MVQLEAIFFDLGDTLVDLGEGRPDYMERAVARTGRVYDALAATGLELGDRQAFSEALAHGAEDFYLKAVAQQRGVDIYDAMRWFLPQVGVLADDRLVKLGGDTYYQGGSAPIPLRTGALEVLKELRAQGVRLGVISNTLSPRRFMDASLERRGLSHFFETCTYSSEVRVAKPHPEIFHASLRAMGVLPERSAYVGDRLVADVAGAQGVGMKAVLVEVPHRPEPHSDIVPDARIAELPELLSVLARLFA